MEVKKILTMKNNFAIILISASIIMLNSCGSLKQDYEIFSRCYNVESNFEESTFYISKSEQKKIENQVEQKYNGFRIVFLVYNKVEKLYYIEILKSYIYYCLIVDSNYEIIEEKKGYLDI